MRGDSMAKGHMAALLTIFIWGTTFIATKILLDLFSPVEILFFRFLIGYLALWAVMPRRLKVRERGEELYFLAAGLCGVTLYFLLENFALTFTLAANVGVIISIAPFFTALFGWLFLKGERPGLRFMAGFAIAMAGIYLISFRGEQGPQVNPIGDGLAVIAAVVWAAYGTLTKKISYFGYGTILTTRRTFFYGLVLMLPVLMVGGFRLGLERFAPGPGLCYLLFLGLGASALCFVTWNYAVKVLGPVKTSAYIYLVPVITVTTSVAVLQEKINGLAVCGIGLTLAGLILSESKITIRRKGRYGTVRNEMCHGD